MEQALGKHPASAGAWRWWWRVASPQRAPCPPPQPSHEEEGTSPRWTSPLWAALGKSQPLSGPCRLGGLGFQTPLPLRPLLLSSFGGGAERGRREAWAPSSHAPSAPGSQCRVHGSVPQYLLLSLGTLSPTTPPPKAFLVSALRNDTSSVGRRGEVARDDTGWGRQQRGDASPAAQGVGSETRGHTREVAGLWSGGPASEALPRGAQLWWPPPATRGTGP